MMETGVEHYTFVVKLQKSHSQAE